MPPVTEHLAELTGFRDRDVLDTTLVGVLRDLLQPIAVTVCHCVGEGKQQRWLVRARLAEGDVAASADSMWAELDELPKLDAFPARLECLRKHEPIEVPGVTHITCFPLLTDLDAIGVLEIETRTDLDAEQLRTVSSMLRVYRNVQGLLDYSERDMLTGLLNRKTFDDAFYKACTVTGQGHAVSEARRERRRTQAYMGIIDIDHFKQVNDRHGHLIGDEVLLLLSRLMRASFRFHDRLYRFGGEEFVVLLRCASQRHATRAFERLRAATEAYAFPQVGRITVSIGFTEVRPGDSSNMAFERADRAVYWAKSHGRNQVAEHAMLVARGELLEGQKTGDVELF
ncbi:MAG TPA: GGDEF domain-containing protein [Burkholderiaceae bacterium]|jgi:diguanylate cyclase (GGDEF)-like protein|nr:GGDEF domain-containing protein [Burkholderiaceae bacterium]